MHRRNIGINYEIDMKIGIIESEKNTKKNKYANDKSSINQNIWKPMTMKEKEKTITIIKDKNAKEIIKLKEIIIPDKENKSKKRRNPSKKK
jgi:hypothetical protein